MNEIIQQEDDMVRQLMTRMSEYLRDAVHVSEIRAENTLLKEQVVKLEKEKGDIEFKLALTEDAWENIKRELDCSRNQVQSLQTEVYRLSHLLDTIRGIVVNNQATLAA